jgi:hypothetical protein
MTNRKKTIRLSPDEDQLLRTLHRQSGVPDGQFAQRPKFWQQITSVWNGATDRRDTPEDLLHYIMTRRKRGKGRPGRWEPFGDAYKPLSCPEPDTLTPEQWEVVDAIYVEMKVGADNFLIDRELRREMLRRFVERAGTHVPELLFAAALIARRKGGFLPKAGQGGSNSDMGFNDINKVA